VQYHLHLQLLDATEYAHTKGLVVKGDIPIGIYRYSCDAWVAPELYNMNQQAGAPPDDFAVAGQNWGFPTYNWERMKNDDFAWWRQRFTQMSLYFDAFRIDHILGFFRIWSIPLHAVEGILGQFIPALPITERELQEWGIGFNYDRLCRPYITERILWETFGEAAPSVCEQFLDSVPQSRLGQTQYTFKPAFDTQRKVEAWYATQPTAAQNPRLRDGLYALLANVILLDTADGIGKSKGDWKGAIRISMENTASFRELDPAIQSRLKELYINYFYRRQDDFWQREAMEKLPALKRSTNMLICGEDLGMVPACVPDVMKNLGILSLEIQRMPKALGTAFLHPKDAPYLSVITPSTHDMSTLRGWWEEDRSQTQRFYNEILGQHGNAPWFCEPHINRMLIEQHLYAPSMWAIFQLQDLMGSDGKLRRDNPEDERINVPANPKHYWRYRMHLTLEALMAAEGFNSDLKGMVQASGRM
jgi:4-alpha-glucanotransferase